MPKCAPHVPLHSCCPDDIRAALDTAAGELDDEPIDLREVILRRPPFWLPLSLHLKAAVNPRFIPIPPWRSLVGFRSARERHSLIARNVGAAVYWASRTDYEPLEVYVSAVLPGGLTLEAFSWRAQPGIVRLVANGQLIGWLRDRPEDLENRPKPPRGLRGSLKRLVSAKLIHESDCFDRAERRIGTIRGIRSLNRLRATLDLTMTAEVELRVILDLPRLGGRPAGELVIPRHAPLIPNGDFHVVFFLCCLLIRTHFALEWIGVP